MKRIQFLKSLATLALIPLVPKIGMSEEKSKDLYSKELPINRHNLAQIGWHYVGTTHVIVESGTRIEKFYNIEKWGEDYMEVRFKKDITHSAVIRVNTNQYYGYAFGNQKDATMDKIKTIEESAKTYKK